METSANPVNKKYLGFKLIVLLCTIIFEGCAHFNYLPSNSNVPLFKEKNEFHGSISIGGGPISFGTDVQAALALTNHLAVMTNYMSSKNYSNEPDDKNLTKANYFEGAAGYFKPLNNFCVKFMVD